jgi:molybdate transport system ATP-binding protein
MLDVHLNTHLNTFHLQVDFRIEAGKTLVLLGESGAGKSTVLRLLAGLLQPDSGSICLNETVYCDTARRIVVPPQERSYGYVFQDYVLFPHLTVFENVAFGLRAQHLSRLEIRTRVRDALACVQLSGLEQRHPSQLSGGQQQRVALARAVVLAPQLLLLDEPLAALDVQTRREVRHTLRQLLSALAVTTVMVTHHYLDALFFGDQILVLDHGYVIQQGGQQELREQPRSSYVAELAGVNFFRGRIIGYESDTTCRIRIGHTVGGEGHEVRQIYPDEVIASLRETDPLEQKLAPGTEANVVIDPRSITLHTAPPEGSARNLLRGEIVHILYLAGSTGHDDGRVRISLSLEPGNLPLTAEITETSAIRMHLAKGQHIYATFKATEASVYT